MNLKDFYPFRDYRKTMSKNNSKSLSALRQKLRKYIREDFDDDMAKFRENPDADDAVEETKEEEDRSDDSDDSDDENQRKSFSKSRESSVPVEKAKFKSLDDDDESDDSYWDSDSDESDESSSSDDGTLTMRERFLKKTTDGDEEKKKKKERQKEKQKEKAKKRAAREDSDDELREGEDWITIDRGNEKPKMFEKDAEINHDLVVKKLHEIMAARGKKRTNKKEQIELLTELLSISEEHSLDVAIYTKIKFAIIAAIFDYNPKVSAAMKPENWEKCMPAIENLLDLLTENAGDLTTGDHITEDQESFTEKPYKVSNFIFLLSAGCKLS